MKYREVELVYIEQLDSSEVLLVFETVFNGKPYHLELILNLNQIEVHQNIQIERVIDSLATMDRNDATFAEKVN